MIIFGEKASEESKLEDKLSDFKNIVRRFEQCEYMERTLRTEKYITISFI